MSRTRKYGAAIFAVALAIMAISACAPKPTPTSPQDIQVIETGSTPAVAPTRDPRLSNSDAKLVDSLIECYKTNPVIWGATKGAVETSLAEAGDHRTLTPEDMRFFLVSAALVEPEEFRLNGEATLGQCAATGR